MEITTMTSTTHGGRTGMPASASTLRTLAVSYLGTFQGTGLSVADRAAKPFGTDVIAGTGSRPSHVVVPSFGRPPV